MNLENGTVEATTLGDRIARGDVFIIALIDINVSKKALRMLRE